MAVDRDQKVHRAVGMKPRRRGLVAGDDWRAPPYPFLRTVGGLLGEATQPDAKQPAVGQWLSLLGADAVEINQGHRAADCLGVIAVVELHVADRLERHRVRRHHVVDPNFHRVAADGPCDLVDGAFDSETCARPCDPTIDTHRRLVGRNGPGLRAKMFDPVGPGQVTRGHASLHERAGMPQRVGAAVDGDLRVDPLDQTPLTRIGSYAVDMLTHLTSGLEMLAHVLNPARRHPGLECDRADHDLLRHQPRLAAEPAANIGRDHPDLADLKPKHLGKP